MGSAPGNFFVFNSDTGCDLCRPSDFPGFDNLHVGHHGLPFGQNLSRLYSGVSVGICCSFGHDSSVTWQTSPAEGQPKVCHQNVVYHIAKSLAWSGATLTFLNASMTSALVNRIRRLENCIRRIFNTFESVGRASPHRHGGTFSLTVSRFRPPLSPLAGLGSNE